MLPISFNNQPNEQNLIRQRDEDEEVGTQFKKQKTEASADLLMSFSSLDTSDANPLTLHTVSPQEKNNPTIGNLFTECVEPPEDIDMIIEESNLEPGPFCNAGILKNILSYSSVEDLLLMRVNKRYKTIAEALLIERLNNGEILLSHIGINTVDAAIAFFGEGCSKILLLDLNDFSGIQDEDIEKISQSFSKLNQYL